MPVKLSELARETGLSASDLKKKLKELGVSLKPLARNIDDQYAALLRGELAKKSPKTVEAEPTEKIDTIKAYEYFIERELDKEIIKTQRKMTAGKDIKTKKPSFQKTAILATEVEIPDTITVKEFAEKTGLNPVKVIGELMKNGILANINQTIDFETAEIVAMDSGITLKRKRKEAKAEDISTGNLEMLLKEEDSRDLKPRPPIVTVMGHVDHGKTKLLDAIRETDVVSGEAGGITQHIGAYQVEKNGRKITFIDTPGHEAFTQMRARGASITDMAILVVAADEGVKPQTVEALDHAKDAEVPIIVAINKIDKEDINIDRVKAQLAELGLQPEDWGGKTPMVPVSAMTSQGIPTLLEIILLIADLENLKANPNRPAVATIIEAHLDKNLGPVSTVIVNAGTLRIHDAFVCGDIFGRVKTMQNHLAAALEAAPPATPVRISGLESTPQVGDIIQVVRNLEEARNKAEDIRMLRLKGEGMAGLAGIDRIMSAIQAGKLKTLKVVLKADTFGTLEALKLSLTKVKKDEVSVKVIHSGVGAISESDVMMAAASGGIVVGFNSLVSPHVRQIADRNNVQIFLYQIIYQLIEDLKKILSGLLEPEVSEIILGRATVRKVFMTEKKSMIVGCKVMSGKIENKTRVRVFRDENHVADGFIASLKRINDVVHEIGEGNECGIKFESEYKLQEGDELESWKIEKRTRIVT